MSTYKNQHFVPKVYLKHFAFDENRRAIRLLNVQSETYIPKASIKGQCSKNFFYGKDQVIEKLIRPLEDKYGIASARVAGALEAPNSNEEWALRYFALLQWHRTAVQVESTLARIVQLHDFLRKSHAVKGIEWDGGERPTHDFAVQELILAFNDSLQARDVDDLKLMILQNATKKDFITSDDPAILTNMWLSRRKKFDTFGFGAAGLVISLPITPRICLFMYDASVYHIGPSWKLEVQSRDDVDALNLFQIMNANENVYFSSATSVSCIRSLLQRHRDERRTSRYNLTFAVPDGSNATHKRYAVVDDQTAASARQVLFHGKQVHLNPPLWPSFLRYRRTAHGYTRGRTYLRKQAAMDSEFPFSDFVKKR